MEAVVVVATMERVKARVLALRELASSTIGRIHLPQQVEEAPVEVVVAPHLVEEVVHLQVVVAVLWEEAAAQCLVVEARCQVAEAKCPEAVAALCLVAVVRCLEAVVEVSLHFQWEAEEALHHLVQAPPWEVKVHQWALVEVQCKASLAQ